MNPSMAGWVRRLARADVPVLSQTRTALTWVAGNDDDAPPSDIVTLVLRDPLLTLRVLATCNHRHSEHVSHEVTTVTHALMMCGEGPFLRQFAPLPTIEAHLASHPAALARLEKLIQRARHAAAQAHALALLRQDREPEEAAIAAALLELPQMLLCVHAPAEAARRAPPCGHGGTDCIEPGMTFDALRLPLTEALGLPEMLRALLDHDHHDRPRIFGVQIAARLARHLEAGGTDPAMEEDLHRVAELLHLPADEVARTVKHAAEAGGYMNMDTDDATPHPDRLDAAMQEITAHLDGTLDLHQMMSIALHGAHQGIGLKRVVFALLTDDRLALRPRLHMGLEPGSPLGNFNIVLEPPNLFSRLLTAPQAVWYRADAHGSNPLMTPQLRITTGGNSFFAMSLFVDGKPVGLMYADQEGGQGGLDDAAYASFKKLCLRAAEGLAHLAAPRAA
jgi:hypothetical protein